MYRYLPWIFSLLFATVLEAQSSCGTSGQPAASAPDHRLTTRMEAVFQVVVHIVYADEKENLSDEAIRSQIDILNRDFAGNTAGRYRIPTPFRDKVASNGWQFCLATTDPSGQPTNGIVRVATNEQAIAHPGSLERGLRKIKHRNLGGSDAWDTERYINIWVGSTGEDVVIGDATFPEQAKPGEDGVMVDYRVFGGLGITLDYIPFHLGKTLTHELGHYFNLAHLSGNGDCTVDDGVDDTPLQGREYFSCPGGPVSSCGSEDMVQNFMSLASDPCLLFFTVGQIARMEDALLQFRTGLLGQVTLCNSPVLGEGKLSSQVRVISSVRSGQLLLFFNGVPDQEIRIQLFDMGGRMLLEDRATAEQFYTIETEAIPTGIYALRLTRGSEQHTVKLVL